MATALEVVRIILEYFGWEGYEIEELFYGGRGSRDRRRSIVRRIGRELARYQFSLFTKRSIVREIGSRLPLKPCRRPYFELSLARTELESAEEFEGKPLSQVLMASLADVGWITRDEDSSSNVILDDEEELIDHTSPELETEQLATFNHPAEDKKENSSHSDEAMLKISALEEELQKLRAQIAMMVVSAPQNQVATPSTPVGPVAPPPPPPPPPPTPLSTPRKPVSQIIKENRAKRLSLAPGVCMNSVEPSGGCSLPNMADVLKGLGTVKLRSVERSPGGTPLRKAPIPTDGSDPASIIAQALKKKFAHRRCHEVNSPDANKENSSPGSPFGTSPSSPIKPVPFGPHMLKPTNKKRRSSTGLQKTTKPRTSLVEVC